MKKLTILVLFFASVVTASESDSLETVSRRPFFGDNGLFTIVKRECQNNANRYALKIIKKPERVEMPLKKKGLKQESLPRFNVASAEYAPKKVIHNPKVNKNKKGVNSSKVVPSITLKPQEKKVTTIHYGFCSKYEGMPRNEILMTILQQHEQESFHQIHNGEKKLEDVFNGRAVNNRNYFNEEQLFSIIWECKNKKALGCIVEHL